MNTLVDIKLMKGKGRGKGYLEDIRLLGNLLVVMVVVSIWIERAEVG